MFKLFKTVDEKLEDLGFKKVIDNDFVVSYERYEKQHQFTQVLDIYHKASGRHTIQSFDKNLFDEKRIGNTSVGLTYEETKLALKKMKQKRWKSK